MRTTSKSASVEPRACWNGRWYTTGPTSQSRSACRPSDRSRRGRQAQPHRRGAEDRGLAPASAGQVVLLVEDQQAEARPHLVHVDVRAVVGRHRDRADVERRVADDAGVVAERRQDPPVPLVHQVAHGRDDQRRHLRLGHRGQGHLRLAGAGGHDDLPPPARPHPGGERLRLLGPRLRQIPSSATTPGPAPAAIVKPPARIAGSAPPASRRSESRRTATPRRGRPTSTRNPPSQVETQDLASLRGAAPSTGASRGRTKGQLVSVVHHRHRLDHISDGCFASASRDRRMSYAPCETSDWVPWLRL